jgi:putative lipoic acid-binding regulatory protein
MIDRMSATQQRFLALALLCLALLFFYFGLPRPYMEAVSVMENEISELQDKLSRYRAIGAQRDELQEQVSRLLADNRINASFLQQKTPALAAADLQRLIKLKISESGGDLLSTQSLGNSQSGEYLGISVKVVMRGSSQNLYQLFSRLERQQPLLRIDKLSIVRARTYAAVSSVIPEKLMINFTVTGYIWPQGNATEQH